MTKQPLFNTVLAHPDYSTSFQLLFNRIKNNADVIS